MIRMTLMLSAAVYLTLAIGGQDDGQMRAGLAMAEARPQTQTYRYIPVPEPAPVMQVARTQALPTAVVTVAALNVRNGPSTQDAAIDQLSHGEEVTVVETRGDWTRVRLEGSGGEGWVSSEYLADMPLLMAQN